MRYIDIYQPGEPQVMEIKEGETPDPAKGEVLIRVSAAGVNRPDVMQRQGLYPPPPGASPILGLEVSGEVVAIGEDVSAWSISDRVCALTNGGGYAEYVAVPAGQCLPLPEGLPMAEAAALPETFFTVWTNVFDRAGLKPGESFLVHGGSSGIGTTAIQMAKALGSKVFTTAGSAEKCAACQRLGADVAVNYTEQDYVKVLMEATDGQGVDVILDMVGGDYVARNLELAAEDGRVVSIAFLNGSQVEIDMMQILRKRLTVSGSTLRPRTPEAKAGIAQKLRAKIWPLIESQKIKPLIAARFALADAVEAHKLMESSKHIGKIILTVAD
ncbi:Quinone oxidoreductase (EC [Olavius algarvensis Delta 1 endosymbiont]|nr:Quinone oxidoreductase (EC [Olavius algarvensis Delta 1 endosymbiont]